MSRMNKTINFGGINSFGIISHGQLAKGYTIHVYLSPLNL